MRITQGAFSFLDDLTDTQIEAQVRHCISQGWAVSIECTDDPHPRNTYWEMWEQPQFDLVDPGTVMASLAGCRRERPRDYIRICGFDATRGWESLRTSFIVQRPPHEPGFRIERTQRDGRSLGYTTRPYATDLPPGERYR
ncbi:MAG TPA: ribulose bisphosphate carboxylase small subunit [Acidimicrobiales bacterium]|nr:ribulose bisphosphate carboxylase small subunit [Acidimicrobiales bacterium]